VHPSNTNVHYVLLAFGQLTLYQVYALNTRSSPGQVASLEELNSGTAVLLFGNRAGPDLAAKLFPGPLGVRSIRSIPRTESPDSVLTHSPTHNANLTALTHCLNVAVVDHALLVAYLKHPHHL
jgi:hypothetical protein